MPMKKIDDTYWTDGKDIFHRKEERWVNVTGEDSTEDPEDSSTEDSTIVDAGWIKVYPRGRE
jgi:hypothetical protein